MSPHNLINIIVPVHNAENFLDRCITSVMNQTYPNLELLLVNDGSTDSSEMVCNRFALLDKRIKVISQKNRGASCARNSGIHRASGDFVFFLDADDFLKTNALEILIAGFHRYYPDLVMSNFSKFENNGKIVRQQACFRPGGLPFAGRDKLLFKQDIAAYVRHFLKHPSNHLVSYCWARLYKLSIIKNNALFFPEDMRLFEDFIFNLDYLTHCEKTLFINETLYTYSMHSNHVSSSMAIVQGESFLHDMANFKQKASEFLQAIPQAMGSSDIKKEIGHALIHYLIIFLVRSCRQISSDNKKVFYQELKQIINAPIIRENLGYYSPSRGNSRVLPLLMKFKLPPLIAFVCKQKAYKRYGRPASPYSRNKE